MESVRLEPLNETHLAAVAAMLADPDVLRFTRVPDPTPAGFAREWLALYEAGPARTARARASPRSTATGASSASRSRSASTAPRARSSSGTSSPPRRAAAGAGTAILRALTDWAFAEAGAARIRLVIDVENPASLRVAERSGYVREGVMRSLYFKNGQRIDAVLMSRLPSDPRRRRDGCAARA